MSTILKFKEYSTIKKDDKNNNGSYDGSLFKK